MLGLTRNPYPRYWDLTQPNPTALPTSGQNLEELVIIEVLNYSFSTPF